MKHPLLPLTAALTLLAGLLLPTAHAQMSGSDLLQAKLTSVFAPLD